MLENTLIVLGAILVGAILMSTAPDSAEITENEDAEEESEIEATVARDIAHSAITQKMRVL